MPDDDEVRLPDAPYAFRPAKRIQRIMFCDAVRALRVLRPMDDYQYVGLGHWQFVDFELMRREVGIRYMVSIERNTNLKARFEENLPFQEIDLLFGLTAERLQEVDFARPTIAWLDYTTKLTSRELQDLSLLVDGLPVGSVVAATFNCKPDREDRRLASLEDQVGEVPGDVAETDLDAAGLPRVQRRILVERLNAVADGREDRAAVEQFMFIRYADRSPMAFWAALITDKETSDVALPALRRHEQVREGDDYLDVTVPFLSTREVIALNREIRHGAIPRIPGVDETDSEAYGRLHRWYPAVPLPF